MIKSNVSLSQVKTHIARLKEKQVEVTLALGRNKFVKFMAKVQGVYPALFTVAPFDKSFSGRTSYSYSEFMCGRVRVKGVSSTPEVSQSISPT